MAANSIPPGRKNVPVHLTAQFRDDLAVLMANGARASDVIRAAVADRADAYRRAHDYGDVPDDQDPVITGCTYSGETLPATPTPAPCRHPRLRTGSTALSNGRKVGGESCPDCNYVAAVFDLGRNGT